MDKIHDVLERDTGDVVLPRKIAEWLEEIAAEAELTSYGSVAEPPTNPELNKLATYLYQVMHWYNAPSCRPNHKSWNPEVEGVSSELSGSDRTPNLKEN